MTINRLGRAYLLPAHDVFAGENIHNSRAWLWLVENLKTSGSAINKHSNARDQNNVHDQNNARDQNNVRRPIQLR